MRDGRTFLSIGAVSALLAAFVPGVLDPAPHSASALPPVSIFAGASYGPSIAPEAGRATIDIQPTARGGLAPVPARIEGPRAPTPSDVEVTQVAKPATSTAIPPGCERLVSSLARSVASREVGRCIT